ncbi:MAG: guanylate kinase [Deltaproteobacteria bacterium]|nr:guanylate kinase [Deltaproteobacteria bacterium]
MSVAGQLYVITAPSGTGKTTIIQRLLGQLENVDFSVSHTTRAPRQSEVPGRDYFFVGEAEFKSMVESGAFVEWARVHGNYYGTSKFMINQSLEQGRDLLLDIDIQGAINIKRHYPEAVYIMFAPPSFHELKARLTGRGSEAPESLGLRLANARQEIESFKEFNYMIINQDVDRAVMETLSIFTAERLRVSHCTSKIEDLLLHWDEAI